MKALALKKIEGVKESIKTKRQLDQCKGMRKVLKKAKKARTSRQATMSCAQFSKLQERILQHA